MQHTKNLHEYVAVLPIEGFGIWEADISFT